MEIGPGAGQITRYILARAKKLYCIEKDRNLAALCRERFQSPSVRIINQDILKVDLRHFKKKVVVFGNVPFNISNQLIKYIVRYKSVVKRAYFTFQKEFAHKLAASCGTKEYGYLSCYIQYHARVKIIFDIPAAAFFPIPRVDASFIEITFKTPRFKAQYERFLFTLIARAFSQRRKKIINVLAGICDRDILDETVKELNLDAGMRPDNIPLTDYCRLSRMILAKMTKKRRIPGN